MLIPDHPSVAPQYVYVTDGTKLATYRYGDDSRPTVLAVHGFASHAFLNWELSGWVRELDRAGYSVLSFDMRGHGLSDRPVDPSRYGIARFARDAIDVMNAYGIDEAHYLGYSMGARTGWQFGVEYPHRVRSLSLGGMPAGEVLGSFDYGSALGYVHSSQEIENPDTARYVSMAEGVPENDVEVLTALARGVQDAAYVSTEQVPVAPILLVAGTEDPIAAKVEQLAAVAQARFVALPGRTHLSAVNSRLFKTAVLDFLAEQE